MRRCRTALSVMACLLCAGAASAQTRRALVIGIDLYQPKGTRPRCPTGEDRGVGRCTLPQFDNLRGPVNDADAVAAVLTTKLGFPAAQVHVLLNPWPEHPPQVAPPPGVDVLPADQTNRAGILAAMHRYLVDETQSGDTVVFYYAGHGSLQLNSLGHKLVNVPGEGAVPQHMDSTIVPSDAWTGEVMDVRDHEMTEIFNAALDKGVRLTAIFDSCHSGQMTRGAKHYPRYLLFDQRDVKDPRELPAPAEHSGNGAVVLTAVQQDQTADAARSIEDESPIHGDFTYALVKALQQLPPEVPAAALFQYVQAVMAGMKDADGNPAVVGEDPEMDAPTARRQEPLFGQPTATTDRGKVWTAALGMDDDRAVTLDMGRVSGIGIGSIFESAATSPNEERVELQVTALNGIDRSTAKAPPGVTVNAGDLFVLKTLVHPDDPPLLVWMTPPIKQADLAAAVRAVRSANVVSVADPADEAWTDELSWSGSAWMLRSNATGQRVVSLGAPLSAAALKKHLKPQSKLWVNLPPSVELSAQLHPRDLHSPVQMAPSMAGAEYVLTGSLADAGTQYAWFHRSDYLTGAVPGGEHSPGCSTTSPYPLRSDWRLLGDAKSASELNEAAISLSQVHIWMQRASTPKMASADDFYHLQIQRLPDQSVVPPGAVLRAGDSVQLALHSSQSVDSPRWIYVLDIDCHGAISTAYPKTLPGKSYPDLGNGEDTIVLPVKPTIGTPYGLETLVLLSTSTPLSSLDALQSNGAATRGDTDWGVERIAFLSAPTAAAEGK